MNNLTDAQASAVAGGDLDGNAGEQEARDYMRQSQNATFSYCWDIGSINGKQYEVCVVAKPGTN